MSPVQRTANNLDRGQITGFNPSLVTLRAPVGPAARRPNELVVSTKAKLSDFQRVVGPLADGALTPWALTFLNAELEHRFFVDSKNLRDDDPSWRGPYRGVYEYEQRMKAVGKLLSNLTITELVEPAQSKEIIHVAINSGLSTHDVMRLVLSGRAAPSRNTAPTGPLVFDAFIRQRLPAVLASDPGWEHATVGIDRAIGRSSGHRGRLYRLGFARFFCRSGVDTAVPRCPVRVRVQRADGVYPEVLTLVGDGAANPREGFTGSRPQRADLMRRALQHGRRPRGRQLKPFETAFPGQLRGAGSPRAKEVNVRCQLRHAKSKPAMRRDRVVQHTRDLIAPGEHRI